MFKFWVAYFDFSYSLKEGVLWILGLIFKGEIRAKEAAKNEHLFSQRA